MYALRNVFLSMQHAKMPAREIKEMLPSIVNEMNYTTSLMENLLQWAKTQMKSSSIQPEMIDMKMMTMEAMQILQLQASNKKIYLESRIDLPVYCYADREMINLVLRNLLSNAIKFTPENGRVMVGTSETDSLVEIFVEDTGIGMRSEDICHVFSDVYFTTKGTASENGTGLGLKLCKHFLEKNGGEISIKSHPGEGSIFSFTLPRYCLEN